MIALRFVYSDYEGVSAKLEGPASKQQIESLRALNDELREIQWYPDDPESDVLYDKHIWYRRWARRWGVKYVIDHEEHDDKPRTWAHFDRQMRNGEGHMPLPQQYWTPTLYALASENFNND